MEEWLVPLLTAAGGAFLTQLFHRIRKMSATRRTKHARYLRKTISPLLSRVEAYIPDFAAAWEDAYGYDRYDSETPYLEDWERVAPLNWAYNRKSQKKAMLELGFVGAMLALTLPEMRKKAIHPKVQAKVKELSEWLESLAYLKLGKEGMKLSERGSREGHDSYASFLDGYEKKDFQDFLLLPTVVAKLNWELQLYTARLETPESLGSKVWTYCARAKSWVVLVPEHFVFRMCGYWEDMEEWWREHSPATLYDRAFREWIVWRGLTREDMERIALAALSNGLGPEIKASSNGFSVLVGGSKRKVASMLEGIGESLSSQRF